MRNITARLLLILYIVTAVTTLPSIKRREIRQADPPEKATKECKEL